MFGEFTTRTPWSYSTLNCRSPLSQMPSSSSRRFKTSDRICAVDDRTHVAVATTSRRLELLALCRVITSSSSVQDVINYFVWSVSDAETSDFTLLTREKTVQAHSITVKRVGKTEFRASRGRRRGYTRLISENRIKRKINTLVIDFRFCHEGIAQLRRN